MEETWLHHFTTESRERKTYAWKRDIKSDLNIYGKYKCNGLNCFFFKILFHCTISRGAEISSNWEQPRDFRRRSFLRGLLNWNQSLVSQTKQAKNKAATTAEKIVILLKPTDTKKAICLFYSNSNSILVSLNIVFFFLVSPQNKFLAFGFSVSVLLLDEMWCLPFSMCVCDRRRFDKTRKEDFREIMPNQSSMFYRRQWKR